MMPLDPTVNTCIPCHKTFHSHANTIPKIWFHTYCMRARNSNDHNTKDRACPCCGKLLNTAFINDQGKFSTHSLPYSMLQRMQCATPIKEAYPYDNRRLFGIPCIETSQVSNYIVRYCRPVANAKIMTKEEFFAQSSKVFEAIKPIHLL